MKYVAATVAIVLLVLVIVFSIQNLEIIDVKFLTMAIRVPTFVVVIASYLLGMITGGSVYAILKRARPHKSGGGHDAKQSS